MTRTVAAIVMVLTAGVSSAQVRRVLPAAPTATPAPTAAPTPEPRAEALRTASSRLLEYKTAEARQAIQPYTAAPDGPVRLVLGQVLEQEKRYEESATELRKAADALQTDPAPLVALGETLLRQQKQADAEAAFRTALTRAQAVLLARPTDLDALLAQGVAQQRLKQFDAAATTFTKALETSPENPVVLYQLGVTRAFQQKWQDAVDALTRSVTARPALAMGYYYRGLAQDKLGRKDQLVLDMDQFVKLAPNAPEADRARAILAAAGR